MEDVGTITIKSDGKRIHVKLLPQGDEASGADVLEAMRNLADAVELKVGALCFATA